MLEEQKKPNRVNSQARQKAFRKDASGLGLAVIAQCRPSGAAWRRG